MKILYSPQRNDTPVKYTVAGEVLTLEVGGVVTEVDFSQFPDGEMQEPEFPIVSAKKEDGTVYVQLTTPHGPGAPESVTFPPGDYVDMTGEVYTNIMPEEVPDDPVEK